MEAAPLEPEMNSKDVKTCRIWDLLSGFMSSHSKMVLGSDHLVPPCSLCPCA